MKKSIFLGVLVLIFAVVISCEKDFTDIGTSIVSNTKFGVKDTVLEVTITQRNLDSVRGDNILTGSIGEYWLGGYGNNDYERVVASFVTQLTTFNIDINAGASSDTLITTTLDNAVLRIPYIATNIGQNSDGTPNFRLDSVLGNSETGINVKVYRNNTFLSNLNLEDPSKSNSYPTNFEFEKLELLNEDPNFLLKPNPNDTIYTFDRSYNGGFFKDTIKLVGANPFLIIPLDKNKIKSLLFDKLNSTELATQEAFENYFRGLIVEASGSENTLVPFSFTGAGTPSLALNYTQTRFIVSTNTTDSIPRTASFAFSGIQSRIYKMSDEINKPTNNQVIIQGTAGKVGNVAILQGSQLEDLRAKNWLINDAKITFYIDQTRDTTNIPQRLFLFKKEPEYSSQIQDTYRENFSLFSGILEKENNNNDSYSFNITDYISDVLGPNLSKNSPLVLRVFNQTDNPIRNNVLDTVVNSYNWNPRAVTISNEATINGVIRGTRKAQLKISYTEKK